MPPHATEPCIEGRHLSGSRRSAMRALSRMRRPLALGATVSGDERSAAVAMRDEFRLGAGTDG